jgi:hypothetical protein
MTGLELFYEEAKKRNLTIGETKTGPGDDNGNFAISSHQGKQTMQNFKRISEVYGSLTFFHFSPEDAMKEVFELIEMQLNSNQ